MLNPSPGHHQCHKVSHDWLNNNNKKNTPKVSKSPASHLGPGLPPLKRDRMLFSAFLLSHSLVWKFSVCSETGDSEWRHLHNASGILVVDDEKGKEVVVKRLVLGVWGSEIWLILSWAVHFFGGIWKGFPVCRAGSFQFLPPFSDPPCLSLSTLSWLIHIEFLLMPNFIEAREKQGKWSRPAFRLGPASHLYAFTGIITTPPPPTPLCLITGGCILLS